MTNELTDQEDYILHPLVEELFNINPEKVTDANSVYHDQMVAIYTFVTNPSNSFSDCIKILDELRENLYTIPSDSNGVQPNEVKKRIKILNDKIDDTDFPTMYGIVNTLLLRNEVRYSERDPKQRASLIASLVMFTESYSSTFKNIINEEPTLSMVGFTKLLLGTLNIMLFSLSEYMYTTYKNMFPNQSSTKTIHSKQSDMNFIQ